MGCLMVALAVAFSSQVAAQVPVVAPQATPSDPRAEFVLGNVTTCAQISGVPAGAIRMGASDSSSAGDAFVVGTTGESGTTLNVEITPAGTAAGVVIDAVVVKGSNGYNIYRSPNVPPALPPPQRYISPLNDGGNIPTISHWFVCYHVTDLPVGSLLVNKDLLPPNGEPVTPIPTSFTVIVRCNAAGFEEIVVTFGSGGGVSQVVENAFIPGIPLGTVCTVTELDTGSFPAGSVVTYTPPEAATTGVVIDGTDGVEVAVTNDFSGVEVQVGRIRITKVVGPVGPGATVPDSFVFEVACTDGTEAVVTVPGTGGEGSPVVEAAAGAECEIAEDTAALPPGWAVSYAVDGGPSQSTPPVVLVSYDTTIEVTVTNVPPAGPAPSTSAPVVTTTQPSHTTLPATGVDAAARNVAAGVGLVAGGVVVLWARARIVRRGRPEVELTP